MARLQRDYESPACEQVALGFRSSFLFSPFLRILSNLKDTWPQNALGLEPGSLIGQASAEWLWISSSIGVVSEHAKAKVEDRSQTVGTFVGTSHTTWHISPRLKSICHIY